LLRPKPGALQLPGSQEWKASSLVTTSRPEGITHPSIDELLVETGDSKYSLVIYAARRARQINSYFTPTEGMLQFVGPLVDFHQQEKPLSIAMREIHNGSVRKVSATERAERAASAAAAAAAEAGPALDDWDADPSDQA
jgi:DNA-directed RNA polymerase subunit omega